MAKRDTTSIRLDTKAWITLVKANERHQASVGSNGIAGDLSRAVRGGELEFCVHEPTTGKQWSIPSHQLSSCTDKLLFGPSIADAKHGTLSDFAGCKAVLNRAEFEEWSAANRGKRGSRRPMRHAVQELLQEWFPPKGIPPENILDRELYRRVCREFEARDRKAIPSPETVRRAAGRRKS